MKIRSVVLLMATLEALSLSAVAADKPEFSLVVKDHLFQPAEVIIPANQKVVLVVDNQDATPEEFESHELNREKVIPGNTKAKIYIGPLEAGTYPFYGEFHEKTANGKIIVK